jgi:peroxiredoxin
VDGQKRSLQDFKGKYVVLEWVNHGCPFVKKHYDSGNMQALQKELTGQGAVWLSICSSAEGKQGNMTPAEWKTALAEKKVAATATLLDPEGTVGKTYGAKTTPHMYLIGPDGKLLYKGAIDDRPSTDKADVNGAKNYVRAAFLEAKEGKPVSESDTQAYGCSVKYK